MLQGAQTVVLKVESFHIIVLFEFILDEDFPFQLGCTKYFWSVFGHGTEYITSTKVEWNEDAQIQIQISGDLQS